MFTETELREALEHSAARAHVAVGEAPRAALLARRRRRALPLAAAAAVVALAVGVTALPRDDHGTAAPPVNSAATTPAPNSSAPSQVEHVPVDLTNAVDLLQVRHDEHAYYTIGGNGDVQAGTETFEKSLPGNRTLDVTVVRSPALDPARIPRDKTVAIAGTTGYYSKLKLFPLDASTGPVSDKYTDSWTVAFASPAGQWVFVSIQNGVDFDGVEDPDAIVAAYDALGVRFVADATRLPFRTGYLPPGYRLDSIYAGYGESWTSLSDGTHRIEIDVLHDRAPGDCAGECRATRRIGAHTVNVIADGDARTIAGNSVKIPASGSVTLTPAPVSPANAVEKRILDSLTVAADLSDPSTYWTISDALG